MLNFKRRLAAIKNTGLYRTRRTCLGKTQVVRNIAGKEVISFCSNDYLGLASDARVVKAYQQAINTYGVGSGALCMISGHTKAHQELEEYLAAFTQRESALVFPSGYMANLGVIQALVKPKQTVLADRLSHASLLDGARLAHARLRRYTHADAKAGAIKQRSMTEAVGKNGLFGFYKCLYHTEIDTSTCKTQTNRSCRPPQSCFFA